MIKYHSEKDRSSFEGTIIDIESFGNFCQDLETQENTKTLSRRFLATLIAVN